MKQNGPPNVFVVIVGNKIDLESQRAVSKEMVETYVESIRGGFEEVVFRECSAKTGEGLEELFEEVCRGIERMKMLSKNDNEED